jgi:hypothetical protein
MLFPRPAVVDRNLSLFFSPSYSFNPCKGVPAVRAYTIQQLPPNLLVIVKSPIRIMLAEIEVATDIAKILCSVSIVPVDRQGLVNVSWKRTEPTSKGVVGLASKKK